MLCKSLEFTCPARIDQSFPNSSNNDGTRKFYRQVVRKYIKLFSDDQNPATLRRVNDESVHLLFRAASTAAFYAPFGNEGLTPTNNMLLDLSELVRRGLAEKAEYSEMYKRLVANRRFSKARAFYSKHDLHVFPPLPVYQDKAQHDRNGMPTELFVNKKNRILIRRSVMHASAHVVVLVDPLCHFCRNFLADMRTHPKLLNILGKHAIWLTPPGSILEFDTLQKWDRANPDLQIGIIYNPMEWPMIKMWAVPTFYFFKGEALIATVRGWPAGGNLPALKSALEKIGLSTMRTK